MTKTDNKKGRWTDEERAYIEKYINDKPLEQIALELKRPIRAVKKYKSQTYGKITTKDIKDGLRATPEWKQLIKQFYADELDVFESRYAETVSQFADDVMATEKAQIFQLIKYEIMMDRNLQDKKRASDIQQILQKELSNLRRTGSTPEDKNRILQLEDQIRGVDISMGAKSNEYVALQKQHESILKNLKATREQRVKNAEARRKSWIDIIKSLEEKDFREKEGAELALMQKAISKETKRLSEYHQYSKDVVDKPILTHETVGEE